LEISKKMNLTAIHPGVSKLFKTWLALATIFAGTTVAQEIRQFTAPPPLRIISREDRAEINRAKDSKARIRKTIKLAEAQITLAEAHTAKQSYEAASAALGMYRGLIEDSLTFLGSLKTESNKTRDLYKRVELALRAHAHRFVSIRRSTPAEYSIWIKEIEDFARSGRTEALNSFYGHTVVRDGKTRDEKSTEQSKGWVAPDTKQPQ
jgi:hypothetical protein